MAVIQSQIAHNSGIPLGGLGTGTVEIRPDGYFHEWQIFNLGERGGDWAPQQPEACQGPGPDMPPGALAFFLRTESDRDGVRMRRLGLRTDQHDLYSQAWLKSVSSITFEGQFPRARLTYHDDDLPVEISAVMFSPFAPHDARTSGTPGFNVVFHLKNRTDKRVKTSLLATLKNPLALRSRERDLANSIARAGETAYLTMRTGAPPKPCGAGVGSLGLSVTGGEASWALGDFPEYIRGHVAWSEPFGIPYESLLRDFRDAGRLPSLSGSRSPASLLRLSDEEIAALPSAKKAALVRQLRRYASFDAFWRRVQSVEPRTLETAKGVNAFLSAVRRRLDAFEGEDRARQRWGDVALASAASLEPLEEEEIRFTLAWHFPYHYSAKGNALGHKYERWFNDAEAVSRFLVENFETHRRATRSFADALFDTTLAPEMADAWSGQLTTLVKCSWWTKAGDFGIWEGLGCCGFHTTDITYQGSFNILALFPELQKKQMEMGARFQREDGRVHHFFTPDFSQVDNGFDRVDMNQQFVLLACRDYLWTGDEAYIQRLWPHICRALDNIAQLDADGDGLPDHDTKRNTYDAWNFSGAPSYISSLWLSALLAGIRVAEDLGEGKRAAAWRKTLEKGVASFERKLWNGEYYSLWVEGEERDECCMTDQVSGDWFAHLIGLGSALPSERIVAALRAIDRHNYTDDNGLQNAHYPPGKPRRLSTYGNVQQVAPWTGVEYAIASMMLDFGMVAEGEKVVRNIHERYAKAGRFWNHVECGNHYYRAMSSWAILLGATGFKIDVPRGALTIAPPLRSPDIRAPWVSSTGWGTFEQTAGRFTLRCASGAIEFRELRLNLRGTDFAAWRNGRKVAASAQRKDSLVVLSFRNAVRLAEGDALLLTARASVLPHEDVTERQGRPGR
ncbi:MAG TPA: GH116 family glycosyl hydrolase [Sumerlaeia bacterium]|nr:GH116 family glycosyl hydrolase [Sumerlaeia bacterium]